VREFIEQEMDRIDVINRALGYARDSGYYDRKILTETIDMGNQMLDVFEEMLNEIPSFETGDELHRL
jgi:hypothetical protein